MNYVNLICHGRDKRCFSIKGHHFPVCARCTGIYAGMLLGLVIEIEIGLPPVSTIPILLFLGLPCALDGTTQLVT